MSDKQIESLFDPFRKMDESAVPSNLAARIKADAVEEFGEALVAVIVVGSRVQGTWKPSSDLDVHIVHAGSWQQKRIIGPNRSGFGIALEVTIDPVYPLLKWVSEYKAYAHFFTFGRIVYPAAVPNILKPVFDAARIHFEKPKEPTYGSGVHYSEYQKCLNIVQHALHEGTAERRSSLLLALSMAARLRLTLSGEYYPLYHRLYSQLQEIDTDFAELLRACLSESDPEVALHLALRLVTTLAPKKATFVGDRY